MRESYQHDLTYLEGRTREAIAAARDALEQLVEAVIERDTEIIAEVIADDDRLDELYQEIHREMLAIIARQAPVAGDLRLLTGLGMMGLHLERVGDSCVNIAKMLQLAGDGGPENDLLARFAAIGKELISMLDQAGLALQQRDVALAVDLVERDDEIDRANRRIFELATLAELPEDARQWAGCMLLIGRSFERIGDHIVDLGELIAFIVTGTFEEFSDASHEQNLGAVGDWLAARQA